MKLQCSQEINDVIKVSMNEKHPAGNRHKITAENRILFCSLLIWHPGIYLFTDLIKKLYSLIKVSWWLSCITVLDSKPLWSLHGFPHDALFPSHTQETLLGKNLNVNMTVRKRLSICDGPVTDWLVIFSESLVTVKRNEWVETINEFLTFSPNSAEMWLCKCFWGCS